MDYNHFKSLMEDGNRYINYLEPDAYDVVKKVSDDITLSYQRGDTSKKELAQIIYRTEPKDIERERHQSENYQRVLKEEKNHERRTGFINGAIIFYFTLIFGILIACTLIIF